MDSDLEGEKHEVEPFEATVFTTSRSIRNPISRGVHCCLIVPLVLILAFAISSLSYFAVTHEKIGDIKHVNGHGRCILFADYNEDIQNIDLSSGHACVFSIFGEVAVAVLACLLIIWMIIKTSAGFHMATWMLVCEIPVYLVHMAFAFCVSITVSIGLALTCDAYQKQPTAIGKCSNYTLPCPEANRGSRDTVFFYDDIYKSMVTSWLAVVVLFCLLCVHIVQFIVFCVKRARTSSHQLLPTSDGESSSDGDSTDEAMVPIAELEKR